MEFDVRNSVSLDLETSPGGEVHAERHWAWEWEYIRPVLLMVVSLPSRRRVLSSVVEQGRAIGWPYDLRST